MSCVHHGMMTRDLRVLHKERWDRIYTHWIGGNPYGFWKDALDETVQAITVPLLSRIEELHGGVSGYPHGRKV